MENFNIEIWLDEIKTKLQIEFKEQLLFIGLQGSYARGEATDKSDIDLVVILNHVNLDTIKRYKNIIKNMPFSNKCCGFISGVNEIKNWSKSDLFQFYYETKPLYGNIKNIISAPEKDNIKLSIKMSAEKLYHSACHTFLYENRTAEALECLYKMTFFILQAKYFTAVQKNSYQTA